MLSISVIFTESEYLIRTISDSREACVLKFFNRNKEINVSKMMGSLPGCVYSRAELQSNDCLSYGPGVLYLC